MDNIYLLHGLETFEIEKEISKLEKKYNIDEMSKITYDLLETDISVVIDDAMTVSFLADKKMIIAKNPYFLSTTSPKTKLNQDLSILESYLKSPCEDTILIFYANYEKLDSRKKIVKELGTKAKSIHFEVKDKSKKILEMLNEHLTLDKEMNQFIASMIGDFSLEQASREIEKIKTYMLDGNKITIEELESLISKSLEQNVYGLADAYVLKDYEKALTIYNDLIKQKESPVALLMLIASKVRTLIKIKEYESYNNNFEIAKVLGLNPYAVKFSMQITRKVNMKELKNMHLKIANAEYLIKSGQLEQNRMLEYLIL